MILIDKNDIIILSTITNEGEMFMENQNIIQELAYVKILKKMLENLDEEINDERGEE